MTAEPVKTGYVLGDDDSITHTITIRKADQSTPSWTGHPYGVARPNIPVGGSVPITGTKPVGQGALEYKAYSSFVGYCLVDGDTGELSAVASLASFRNVPTNLAFGETPITIPPLGADMHPALLSHGTITATWGSYEAVVVGESTAAPAITSTPTDVGKAYALASDSAGCTVASDTGAVTGSTAGTDNCKVKVTLSKSGYNNLVYTYTISVTASD